MQDKTKIAGTEPFMDVVSQDFYRFISHVLPELFYFLASKRMCKNSILMLCQLNF